MYMFKLRFCIYSIWSREYDFRHCNDENYEHKTHIPYRRTSFDPTHCPTPIFMVNSWHFYCVWARVRVCLRARVCVCVCVRVSVRACLHLKMEFHALGASVVWHHSLLLMNSFNKTEAAVFSCRLCFLRAFPFIIEQISENCIKAL